VIVATNNRRLVTLENCSMNTVPVRKKYPNKLEAMKQAKAKKTKNVCAKNRLISLTIFSNFLAIFVQTSLFFFSY
jgi:hypothetical protein